MSKVQDYISSGILESYVMGLTSNWENMQVEAMIAKHPEIKQEVETIEANLLALAQVTAVTPPTELKENIFSAIEGRPVPKKPKEVKVIDINKDKPAVSTGTGNIWKWAVAASVTLLLGSVAFNYYLYDKLEKTNAHLAHLTNEHRELGKNFAAMETNYNTTNEELKIYEDPENKMICLMAVSDTNSLAHVYWNEAKKIVFLEVNNLPIAPDTMQYQLWAINNGIPRSAGLLEPEQAVVPVQKMSAQVDSAQVFAITLEKRGGVITPAGQMYVMGKI